MAKETTSWGGVADWYDKLLQGQKDSYQREVIMPNLLRLMDIRKGETVLDLACGQGFFSGAFLNAGAEVIGADAAGELIALAKKNVPPGTAGGARFFVAEAHRLENIGDRSVDKAAIVLAIQNIENVKDVFAECGRVLKDGGKLYLVMNHPAFRVPKRSSWGWDGTAGQYRRIDGYLTEAKIKIQMHPGDDPEVSTISFHRPMQFYVKALAKNGFFVSNLEEWISHKISDSGPRAPAENIARKEIPLFLCLEATRI